MANGSLLYIGLICHGLPRRCGAVPLHRIVKADVFRVQVRCCLLHVCVTEHPLHMVKRPAGLEHPASSLVAQIVEVQVDCLKSLPALA